MKTKLDTAYLALLAALGLELACTSDPKSTDDSSTTMSTSTSRESESTAEGGSETATETGEPEPAPFECLDRSRSCRTPRTRAAGSSVTTARFTASRR